MIMLLCIHTGIYIIYLQIYLMIHFHCRWKHWNFIGANIIICADGLILNDKRNCHPKHTVLSRNYVHILAWFLCGTNQVYTLNIQFSNSQLWVYSVQILVLWINEYILTPVQFMVYNACYVLVDKNVVSFLIFLHLCVIILYMSYRSHSILVVLHRTSL